MGLFGHCYGCSSDHVIPKRIRENQDHRHHKAINRGGLDHRQADEKRARDGRGGVRLLGQRGKCGGDGAAFAEGRSDAADTGGESPPW